MLYLNGRFCKHLLNCQTKILQLNEALDVPGLLNSSLTIYMVCQMSLLRNLVVSTELSVGYISF